MVKASPEHKAVFLGEGYVTRGGVGWPEMIYGWVSKCWFLSSAILPDFPMDTASWFIRFHKYLVGLTYILLRPGILNVTHIPSLKLTTFSHLKNGWMVGRQASYFPFGDLVAYFQKSYIISFRESISLSQWTLKKKVWTLFSLLNM